MEYLIGRINWKMVELFSAENPAQIAHTQSVHNYTRLLAARSGCAERRIALLELAAMLHDIGCPAARAKYGDCKPPHQEQEGAAIAAEWLRDCPELNGEEKKFIVVDKMAFDEIKTKNFANMLKNLDVAKALVVLEDGNTNAELSARNIEGVKTAKTNTVSAYDVMKYGTVIATEAAVRNIEEVYA